MARRLEPSTMRLTLILGALSAFGPLSIDMYLPALPALAREFGTDTAAVQLTLSIFFIGLALGQALLRADRRPDRPAAPAAGRLRALHRRILRLRAGAHRSRA